MLNDNLLENRLNAVKQGKAIPENKKAKTNTIGMQQNKSNNKQVFMSEVYKLFQVITTSLLYGIGIGAIFATDWSIIQMLGVGIIANHTIFNLFSILSKPFQK